MDHVKPPADQSCGSCQNPGRTVGRLPARFWIGFCVQSHQICKFLNTRVADFLFKGQKDTRTRKSLIAGRLFAKGWILTRVRNDFIKTHSLYNIMGTLERVPYLQTSPQQEQRQLADLREHFEKVGPAAEMPGRNDLMSKKSKQAGVEPL